MVYNSFVIYLLRINFILMVQGHQKVTFMLLIINLVMNTYKIF